MVVLDTSVVSIIFRGDTIAPYYERIIEGNSALISFQTLQEVWKGTYINGWGQRRKNELAQHLDQYRIVWPNRELVATCALLQSERQKVGRRISMADAWIASTAMMMNCPLATHDRDFSGIPNLRVISAHSR